MPTAPSIVECPFPEAEQVTLRLAVAACRLRVAAARRGTTQGRILDELILANLPPADPLPTPDVRRAGQTEPFTPETLKQEMARYGVSQAALAAALGLNQKSVNEWFLRGRIPQQRQAEIRRALADYRTGKGIGRKSAP